MSYTLFQREHLVVVRWGTVTKREIDEVCELGVALERRLGRKLIYAGLQYEDFVTPDTQLTRTLIQGAAELAKHCSHFYVGLCARGVTATLHRSAVRSMLTLARITRAGNVDRVVVVDSVKELLEHAGAELPGDRATLARDLAAAGMT
jgi:hypothetical protein